MKDNKINLNEYKVNYPILKKFIKQIEELKIPYRAITISDGEGGDKQFLYDTTGPYTDPNYNINLDLGLPKGRDHWLQDRHHEFNQILDLR